MTATNDATLYSEWLALRDRQRILRAHGSFLVAGDDLPWEANPQGLMRWYLHPLLSPACHRALIFFLQKIPAGSRSGKQHCQGGIVHYIWQGRGKTVINGTSHAWAAGDVVQLPLLPEGATFQHFNDDPAQEALLLSCQPNLSDPLGVDRGSGFFQLEAAPEYEGEFDSEQPALESLRGVLQTRGGAAPAADAGREPTTYDRNFARTRAIQERSRSAKVVVRTADRPEEITRQGRLRYYLNRTALSDTVLKDWNVFTHELRTHSGKHRHQGGLAIFVLEGKGYTVADGQRCDWKSGDLILLPIQPGGIEHQHFNLNGNQPSRWIAFIYKPFHDEVAHEMEQREESPEYRRPGNEPREEAP